MFNAFMRLNHHYSFTKVRFNDIFYMTYKGIKEWKRKARRKVSSMKCHNVVIVTILSVYKKAFPLRKKNAH